VSSLPVLTTHLMYSPCSSQNALLFLFSLELVLSVLVVIYSFWLLQCQVWDVCGKKETQGSHCWVIPQVPILLASLHLFSFQSSHVFIYIGF
jgi:hypothetical protein